MADTKGQAAPQDIKRLAAPQDTKGQAGTATKDVRNDPSARAVMYEAQAGLTTEARKQPQSSAGLPPVTGKWVLPGDLPKSDQAVVAALSELLEARTMCEHKRAWGNTSYDVQWDAPLAVVQGRDAMRVTMYWAKSIGTVTFEPIAARSDVVEGGGRTRLSLDVVIHVMPFKPWWMGPATWFIPDDIPIRAAVTVGVVRGPSERADAPATISWVVGRLHNIPTLPTILRHINGMVVGQGLSLTEGLWSKLLAPLGVDNSYAEMPSPGPAATRPY